MFVRVGGTRSRPHDTIAVMGVGDHSGAAGARPLRQKIAFCTTGDGVRLAYATMGDGPVLIKAANWITHLETDPASPVWGHWLREVSRRHRFIRYDLRGCGLSDRDVPDMSFDLWLRDFEAVIDASKVERFSLLGVSGASTIAIAYAAKHPERVERLVILNGCVRGRLRRTMLSDKQQEHYDTSFKLVELGWDKENPSARYAFWSQRLPGARPEQLQRITELARGCTSPENAIRILHIFSSADVSALASRVRCPTLVFHSTGDEETHFDEGRLVASLIPDARFVPLNSKNHAVLEHEPAWKVVVEELRAFLPRARPAIFGELTTRETEILELIARGATNPEISAALALTTKTVKNHVSNIFAKLDVTSRGQAIVRAREAGFGVSGSAGTSGSDGGF